MTKSHMELEVMIDELERMVKEGFIGINRHIDKVHKNAEDKIKALDEKVQYLQEPSGHEVICEKCGIRHMSTEQRGKI